jgi:hypothetical protein
MSCNFREPEISAERAHGREVSPASEVDFGIIVLITLGSGQPKAIPNQELHRLSCRSRLPQHNFTVRLQTFFLLHLYPF